jgi:alpha-1,3-mannosyl-glycoprotein beta-1,2-N-acetylglucosaminyltransferase
VQDDLEVAPDFFSYFAAMATLLRTDLTLLAASAYNDNGQQKYADDARRVVRSDFFPGLGWMMPRRIWDELGSKWPDGTTTAFVLMLPLCSCCSRVQVTGMIG